MNQEVVRRQYLEAMGIATLASRYRLPNARPTEACEWDDTPPERETPGQRLHALLDDAQQVAAERRPPAPVQNPASLKAMLSGSTSARASAEQPAAAATPTPAHEEATPEAPREPLRFTLSCMCLGGRWLSLHEGELPDAERRLLTNIYRAAGIAPEAASAWHTLSWPPLAGGPEPQAPLEEAREGVQAFIDGASRRGGWCVQRVLWWGDDATTPLARVLGATEEHGVDTLLGLSAWQGPALGSLLGDGAAKRALWPALARLGEQWQAERGDD